MITLPNAGSRQVLGDLYAVERRWAGVNSWVPTCAIKALHA